MAKNRPLSRAEFEEPTEPVQDPSLSAAVATIATDEQPADFDRPDASRPVLRPSELARLMAERGYTGDPYRFLREEGLPSPVRKYRVTGAGPVNRVDTELQAVEIDAVDQGEAIRQFVLLRQIKQSEAHRFRFQTVVLEE